MSSKPVVLVTRSGEGIAEQLEKRGFEPIILPLIAVEPVSYTHIQRMGEKINDYQWIFFTSKNAVKYFFSFFNGRLPSTIRIAVVGEKTKEAVEFFGYSVSFVPSAFDGDTFVNEIKEVVQPEEKILFPKGNLARQDITVTLKKQGITVHDVVVYETKLPKGRKEELVSLLKNRQVDVIIFASPSAVENFTYLLAGTKWRQWLESTQIACIGPVTKQKVIDLGMNPAIAPPTHTFSALVDELVKSQ